MKSRITFDEMLIEGLSVSGRIGGKLGGKATGKVTPPKPSVKPAPKPARTLNTPKIAISGASSVKPTNMLGAVKAATTAIKATAALPKPVKEAAASNIAIKAITSIANKTPILPAKVPTLQTVEKAEKVLAPIAQACGCDGTRNIRIHLHRHMADVGMPPHSADSILAMIHDMNASLEKAAQQRLATYEHNSLVAKHNFEHKVLSQLARLAKTLPFCHPVRTKAHLTIFKKAGQR